MRIVLACLLLSCLAAAEALPERAGVVRKGDTALTLVGTPLAVGGPAPDAIVRDAALAPVALSSTAGAVRIVLTVPSLDTPVCSREAKAFDREAAALPDVRVVLVSRDLPFAQARSCQAGGITSLMVLSDYESGALGRAWGLYLKENGLLARAVVVLDAQGVVRHLEIVPQLTSEPDYAAALAAARGLAKR